VVTDDYESTTMDGDDNDAMTFVRELI